MVTTDTTVASGILSQQRIHSRILRDDVIAQQDSYNTTLMLETVESTYTTPILKTPT
jgi:hypothetical protein